MPRRSVSPPRLCRHPNGQACVYVRGRARYLGRADTPEADRRYREFVVAWAAGRVDQAVAPSSAPAPDRVVTVAMAAIKFYEWAKARYRHPDGSPTGEAETLRLAIRPLRRMFGSLPLEMLGPMRLRQLRGELVRSGLARTNVNRTVGRVRYFVRWCVGHELVGQPVYEALRAVEPLAPGQGAREAPRRGPVSRAIVEATLPHLSPLLVALVEVLWNSGARVGEALALTTGQLDRSGDVWLARLERHKNAWRGQGRVIPLGPRAIEALRPWLREDDPDAPIFDPRLADDRSAARTGERAPGERYSRSAPTRAIARACRRAGVAPWSLAQLRHARATELRERFGLDVAAAVLGHAKPSMTAHYSREALAHAVEAVRQAG
jgi:integrase